jgi:putative SOS response-associated peptidase YedK
VCGRFVSSFDADALAAYFAVDEVREETALEPSYNVAPTDRVWAVAEATDGRRLLGTFAWGLGGGGKLINARAETLSDKPSFRDAFRRRRCLIPATGFFEWRDKKPLYISPPNGEVLAFAGLWNPDKTCTIVTTAANDLLSPIHERMPVILPPEAWTEWLARQQSDTRQLSRLLRAAADDLLTVRPVSTAVNNVRNNGQDLLTAPAGAVESAAQ